MQFAITPLHPKLGIVILDAGELQYLPGHTDAPVEMRQIPAEIPDVTGKWGLIAGVALVNPGTWSKALRRHGDLDPAYFQNEKPNSERLDDTYHLLSHPITCFETWGQGETAPLLTLTKTKSFPHLTYGATAYSQAVPFVSIVEASRNWSFRCTRARAPHVTPVIAGSNGKPESPLMCLLNRACVVCIGAWKDLPEKPTEEESNQLLATSNLLAVALTKLSGPLHADLTNLKPSIGNN